MTEHKADCFALQKFSLRIFGLLPSQNIFYKFYSFSLLIGLTTYPVLVIPGIIRVYYDNFSEFIFSMLFEVGQSMAVICMLITFRNRFELEKLFENLQLLDKLPNFINTDSENKLVKQYKDLVKKQFYLGFSSIVFVLISYTLMSVVLSLHEEEWILPFGSGLDTINNNFQFVIQILAFGIIASALYLALFIYINILTLICGHCKLLQKFIVIAFTGFQGTISKEHDASVTEKNIIDWKSFKVQLQHIVPYHVDIINAANQMENIFSSLILTFFGGVSISLCLVIYHTELNVGIAEVLKDFILIVSGYSLLIIISSYGEKITTESGKIAGICYDMDFANSDLRIQKALILMMIRSQKPITPTIGKLRFLNLPTMLSIFQTIYTYYTFLRNMKSK